VSQAGAEARDGRGWIAAGAAWAAAAVLLGAFGAHALAERLGPDGEADWQTAVRYQLAHALAILVHALFRERHGGSALAAGCFLVGSLLFSGSIYLLALDLLDAYVWPLTPLGGLILIAGWVAWAVAALRPRFRDDARP
jgi:uncharacterized membrane protein YgdD (TMEM256/DUF423 family)